MGKGGAQPEVQKQEITQTNLPSYVRPYFERLLQRTEAESQRPYQPFQGQRIADVSPDVTASEERIRNIADQGLPGMTDAMGRVRQGLDFKARQFTGDEVSKYMSPYMDQVVARQKESAIDDYRQQLAGGRADAISAGAFGGSREGVQRALGEEALYDRLADIDATGRQRAFDQATSAFQADRAADVDAERLGLGAAGSLAGLSERARAGDVDAARLLETIGKAGMARDQTALDMAFEDFNRQRAYPQEKLGLLSSVLRGIPVQPSTTTTQYQPVDPLGRALGYGLTALAGSRYLGNRR